MLLAEIEIWHTRPTVPTRRVALGHLVLPVDPAPGFGGLLLGAVIARHISGVHTDLAPDIHRLVRSVETGARVVQPRLRHRYQVDRHGLAHSTHRLVGVDDEITFEFRTHGTDMSQVLGAVYAMERLDSSSRRAIAPLLLKAMAWTGPIGPSLIAHLAGAQASSLSALADPRAWALDVLGFPVGTAKPSKREVTTRYRDRMRAIHPDHGGDRLLASAAIVDLNEARRILTSKGAFA